MLDRCCSHFSGQVWGVRQCFGAVLDAGGCFGGCEMVCSAMSRVLWSGQGSMCVWRLGHVHKSVCTGTAGAQQHVESWLVPADLWTHEQLAGAAARVASGVRVDVPGPMPWMQVCRQGARSCSQACSLWIRETWCSSKRSMELASFQQIQCAASMAAGCMEELHLTVLSQGALCTGAGRAASGGCRRPARGLCGQLGSQSVP